jgi:hypothetical protein
MSFLKKAGKVVGKGLQLGAKYTPLRVVPGANAIANTAGGLLQGNSLKGSLKSTGGLLGQNAIGAAVLGAGTLGGIGAGLGAAGMAGKFLRPGAGNDGAAAGVPNPMDPWQERVDELGRRGNPFEDFATQGMQDRFTGLQDRFSGLADQSREMGTGMIGRGQGLEDEYLDRLRGFDPMAAATAANQAQFNMVMPQIQQAIADLRGSQAAQGRLRSGFGMLDQDNLMEKNLANLNQSMTARAMEAANMQAGVNRDLGGFASGVSGRGVDMYRSGLDADRAGMDAGRLGMDASRLDLDARSRGAQYGLDRDSLYLDAIYGRQATEEDRRAAEAASKRSAKGAIAGAGIGALGTWAGTGFKGAGGIGGAIGNILKRIKR